MRRCYFILFLFISSDIYAQINHATIKGQILNEKKEAIIGAFVEILQNGIVTSGTATDEDGNYIIRELKPGLYTIKVMYNSYYPDSSAIELSGKEYIKNVQLQPNGESIDEIIIQGGCHYPKIIRYNIFNRTWWRVKSIFK
jgi:iron complex outermembrane receptor protein